MKERMTFEEAGRRIEKLAEFYRHLAAWLLVNGALTVYNVVTGQTWFIYPLLGWGIGIAAHAAAVFGMRAESAWKDKKIREMIEKGK